MSSVSKPITPTDDSLTWDLPIGLQPTGDSCVESVDGLLADCPSAGDPPSCDQVISTCTPIHSCYNTTERFGINDLSRIRIRPMLAANIAPYILGPMPPDAFLDRFLPLHSISIPEGTPNFQAGMFTSLLPRTGATCYASCLILSSRASLMLLTYLICTTRPFLLSTGLTSDFAAI
jgi:hypothetical protein